MKESREHLLLIVLSSLPGDSFFEEGNRLFTVWDDVEKEQEILLHHHRPLVSIVIFFFLMISGREDLLF